ncbi:MAG TPA: patatin-like phospholipase family protein [Polyangiales bacterium]|jgi:NTE family protein|nr:patatin-like phospholipase family protein [Polyangiales bacterium]
MSISLRPSWIPPEHSVGIVLSGGGARGAYEAGVVAGIMEVLRPRRAPFDVLCGTSVGGLNAAYLASHAHLPDMNAAGLISQWQALELSRHLRLDMRGLLGVSRTFSEHKPLKDRAPANMPRYAGRSLLDAGALEAVVQNAVNWSHLHHNVQTGRVRALIIAALQIGTGTTTLFAEVAPGVEYRAGRDRRRTPVVDAIRPDHVLASAAIPLMFPARRVGSEYYCDGGVRFNTPIAPAIRAGARRLVVISLLTESRDAALDVSLEQRLQAYRSPIFLIGKVLSALLLDPLDYDLQVLARFNRLLEVLEQTLTPDELGRVQAVMEEERGLGYRSVETLVFRPSRDIGQMARERAKQLKASMFSSWLLARTATLGAIWESDLLSFILFDSEFARQLIQLGRDDTVARADDIRNFFRFSKRL